MRTAMMSLMLIVFGFGTHAQLTLQPRMGFENARTLINYNNGPSVAPLDQVFSPQMSIRLDYKFKQVHGPYLGVQTTRTTTNYNVEDLSNGATMYTAAKGNSRLAITGGYELSTRAIYFKKKDALAAKTNHQKVHVEKEVIIKQRPAMMNDESTAKSAYKRNCGDKSVKKEQTVIKEVIVRKISRPVEKGWFMKVQPSAGLALVPFAADGIDRVNDAYQYKAGHYSTAFTSGLGFVLGKNETSRYLVSLNYYKGLGNLDTETVTAQDNGKTTTATMNSKVSGWTLNVGVPINLSKTKKQVQQIVEEKKMQYKKHCQPSYKPHCNKQGSEKWQ